MNGRYEMKTLSEMAEEAHALLVDEYGSDAVNYDFTVWSAHTGEYTPSSLRDGDGHEVARAISTKEGKMAELLGRIVAELRKPPEVGPARWNITASDPQHAVGVNSAPPETLVVHTTENKQTLIRNLAEEVEDPKVQAYLYQWADDIEFAQRDPGFVAFEAWADSERTWSPDGIEAIWEGMGKDERLLWQQIADAVTRHAEVKVDLT